MNGTFPMFNFCSLLLDLPAFLAWAFTFSFCVIFMVFNAVLPFSSAVFSSCFLAMLFSSILHLFLSIASSSVFFSFRFPFLSLLSNLVTCIFKPWAPIILRFCGPPPCEALPKFLPLFLRLSFILLPTETPLYYIHFLSFYVSFVLPFFFGYGNI